MRIAVSQFPVSNDIRKNEKYITKHIIDAADKKADIIHFPETALSGYETDIDTLDWDLLKESLDRIKSLAKEYEIYVILGSHQKQPRIKKPLNSIYLISKTGLILGSYSKTNLYQNENNRFSCKSNFLVKTHKETLIILHALFEFSCTFDLLNKNDKEIKKLWCSFIGIAKEEKWSYLINLASQFNNRPPYA